MLDWQPVERLRSGLASVRPPRWQTTLARLFCARCSTSRAQLVRRRAWRYSSPTWNRQYRTLLSELSRRLAQYPRDTGRVYGCCTPSLPPWRDSRISGASRSLRRVTSVYYGTTFRKL